MENFRLSVAKIVGPATKKGWSQIHFFSPEEKESGLAAFLMGCVGVTEGAIPFAAKSPLKIIPTLMAGSVVGGITAALLKVESMVAWAGFIVLPVVKNRVGFVIALIAGSLTTALLLIAVMGTIKEDVTEDGAIEEDIELELEF